MLHCIALVLFRTQALYSSRCAFAPIMVGGWKDHLLRLSEETAERPGKRLVQRLALRYSVPSNLEFLVIKEIMRVVEEEVVVKYRTLGYWLLIQHFR